MYPGALQVGLAALANAHQFRSRDSDYGRQRCDVGLCALVGHVVRQVLAVGLRHLGRIHEPIDLPPLDRRALPAAGLHLQLNHRPCWRLVGGDGQQLGLHHLGPRRLGSSGQGRVGLWLAAAAAMEGPQGAAVIAPTGNGAAGHERNAAAVAGFGDRAGHHAASENSRVRAFSSGRCRSTSATAARASAMVSNSLG